MEVIRAPATESFYEVGQTFEHLASDNRYQMYAVNEIRWEPDAMMGAGCYIYVIDFIEYDSSSMQRVTRWEQNWVLPEISLPRVNRRDWNQREA